MRVLNQNHGVTLVEIVVILAILIIILAISFSSFINLNKSEALSKQAVDIVAILENARSQTLSSKNSSQYGVHFSENSVVFFKGNDYGSAGANDIVNINLNPNVFISTISLYGSGDNVIFERVTGKTAQFGSITVSLKSNNSLTKTVNINATGLIEVN